MIKKQRLQGILIGAIGMLVLFTSITAFAEPIYKQISVMMGGIRIVVDGEEITPKDANGNVVEVLSYNGTTYLPIRAITNAITKGTKNIEWDQQTSTVFIGEKQPTGKTVKIEQLKPISGYYNFKASSFSVRQNQYTPFNNFYNYEEGWNESERKITKRMPSPFSSPIFLLKGNYAKMSGSLAIEDGDLLRDDWYGVLEVYANNSVNGNMELIYTSPKVRLMKEPIDIEVPLTAVDKMMFKIITKFDDGTNGFVAPCHFFNIELTEAGN